MHDVSWRPLQNCDSPGVVSVREVDCDGRVFVVFDGGTVVIHPLSYRAASLSDVDCVTLRLCAGDEVDNRGRLAGVVSSDRNAPIGP